MDAMCSYMRVLSWTLIILEQENLHLSKPCHLWPVRPCVSLSFLHELNMVYQMISWLSHHEVPVFFFYAQAAWDLVTQVKQDCQDFLLTYFPSRQMQKAAMPWSIRKFVLGLLKSSGKVLNDEASTPECQSCQMKMPLCGCPVGMTSSCLRSRVTA